MKFDLVPGMNKIEIKEGGNYELVCEDTKAVVFDVQCEGEVNLEVTVKENGNATILWLDHSKGELKNHQLFHVKKDALLTVAYAELSGASGELDCKVLLEESGAHSEIQSATVASSKLKYAITCDHLAPYTIGNMGNYGVVNTGALWDVVATGKISKGNYQSKSHQSTRVLTFSPDQTVKVLPILLIDENDVEASHATSLGQPDENQLYYMESRGLSRNEAVQLLAIGYLLPIANVIEDETLQSALKEEIEEKVQQLCLM